VRMAGCLQEGRRRVLMEVMPAVLGVEADPFDELEDWPLLCKFRWPSTPLASMGMASTFC
jgi:hypothetical protein